MKAKFVTRSAETDIQHISTYIRARNPEAAARYYREALASFEKLQDDFLPKRAGDKFPDYVRQIEVASFKGYSLRIAVFEKAIYLIAAFAPGLSDKTKDERTGQGLWET